jgi:hypothetical protein
MAPYMLFAIQLVAGGEFYGLRFDHTWLPFSVASLALMVIAAAVSWPGLSDKATTGSWREGAS